MKRILLFIVTNLAVMLVLGIAASLLGVNRYLTANGLNLGLLLGFAGVMGFGGAIISLLMSKPMAKWSTGAQIINDSPDPTHRWIVGTVANFAQKAGIGMPEVAIYDGEPNAFATGAFKNSALVAVSTGLLHSMNREEVEAVIGHEVAHVANGDMVTMTLIQGVMNTFVVFLSRVIGYFVDKVVLRNDRDGVGIGYYDHHRGARHRAGRAGLHRRGLVLAAARIPRRRRRRAADGPQAAHDQRPGAPGRTGPRRAAAERAPWASAASPSGLMALFSSHPPMEDRIRALQQLK
jgi:heat shock protein HtpX